MKDGRFLFISLSGLSLQSVSITLESEFRSVFVVSQTHSVERIELQTVISRCEALFDNISDKLASKFP